MNVVGPILVFLVIGGLATLITIDVRTQPARDAAAAAKAEVLIDGKAADVHTVTDKKQGLTWRVIYVDRGAIVIPGSEQPLAVEKP